MFGGSNLRRRHPATFDLDEFLRSIRIRRMKLSASSFPRVSAVLAVVGSLFLGFSCPAAEEWIQLFNGKNLDGWTPKIKGFDLGENFANTFRVENGAICVRYDGYTNFNNCYGHLFYKEPFSNYVLRIEYRFLDKQVAGGAGWALRNSGVMIHCQAPETIGKNQDFPVSIEVQFLGGDGKNPRSTCNLCTPGTHVVYEGKLWTPHCTNSKSKTFSGDQWVTAEVEAHGNGKIIHRVNGEQVMEYEKPQLDPNDGDAKKLIKDGNVMLFGGYISLQSESHPIEFRKVEIRKLAE